MKKNKVIIIVSILAALCVLYYFYISTNDKVKTKEEKKVDKDIERLFNKNLNVNYPATPREVIEYYSEILTYMYSGEASAKEIEELGKKCRIMFDAELLAENNETDYIKNLKSEIKQYKEEHKTISTCIIEKSGDVEYKTFESHYYAFVECAYYVKGENSTSRTLETYTLRKDSEGKWKILYWKLTPMEE